MSSVFNVSFKDNLERLRQLKDGPKEGGNTKPQESFVDLLQKLHPDLTKSHDNNRLADTNLPSEPANEVLTNLTTEESVPKVSHSEPPIELSFLRNISLGAECRGGVNGTEVHVKVPAPRDIRLLPPAIEDARPPEKPEIADVKRVAITQRSPYDSRRSSYSNTEIESIIETAGKYHGVSPELGLAVAHAESSLQFDAVSKDGHFSKGVFQLLDTTAKELKGRFSLSEDYDPFDPAMNAFLGVGYLRRLQDLFSEKSILSGTKTTFEVKSAEDLEKLSVAAFNAGEGNVAAAQKKALHEGKNPGEYSDVAPHLPPSTRTYVDRVINYKVQFAKRFTDPSVG